MASPAMKPSRNPYAPPAHQEEKGEDSAERSEAPRPRAWIEDGRLAVSSGARLPAFCLKCARTGEMRWRKHVFASSAPNPQKGLGKRVLVGALFGPIAASAMAATELRVAIELPLCRRCEVRWT